MIKKILKKKLPGWMGKTHALLSIFFMGILMLIPFYPLQITFGALKNDILLYIVSLAVLVGGALLPDLDNAKSTALVSLGPIGSLMTLFMRSTSSMMWNIYHFKNDVKTNTQHRNLWHTPIIGIGLIALFYFGLPNGNYTIFTNIKNSIETGQILRFIQTNATLLLFIILCFMAVLIGSAMLISLLSKIVKIPGLIKYILPVAVLVYIFITSYSNLRILGVCLGTGYLLHCLEDFICDSSIPIIWPIPAFWKKKVWWRPSLPLKITTGGTLNTIIDYIAFILAIGIMVLVFIKK